MTVWRGGLLSSYFLTEGAPGLDDYKAIDDATVATLEGVLATRLGAVVAMHKPNEAQTERDLIDKVLDALGWANCYTVQAKVQRARIDVPDYALFTDAGAKAAAAALADPREHFMRAAAIVEAKAWEVPLDRGTGALGSGVPSSQMLRYLNNVEVASERRIRFGVLTNGRLWRLYDQQAASKIEDYLKLDLLALLAGLVPETADLPALDAPARAHALRLFLMFFGRNAFIRDADGRTAHNRALGENLRFETRVTDDLSRRVFDDVFPELAAALHSAARGSAPQLAPADLADLREATLTYLYRLLFVLYAEDRDLLPSRTAGYEQYSLSHVRDAVAARLDAREGLSTTRTDYDNALRELWRQIDKGDPDIGVPPYNGGLFAPERSPLLEQVRVPDAALAPLIDALSRLRLTEHGRTIVKRISYRDLSVRHLGSIYERLLEFDLAEGDAGAIVVRPSPFARKTSGSYYTPDNLVQLIVRRTLGPLIEERRDSFTVANERLRSDRRPRAERLAELARQDTATAITTLKVCDPAMGSGHFLVSAVDYLTDAVLVAIAGAGAAVDWADGQAPYASPLIQRIADIRARILANAAEKRWRVSEAHLDDRHLVRRMVLKRCIYGVDKNPMAVELAKLSLWLHSFTVGAPLSFLDHHLRCGDSLFGEWARPAIERLAGGGLFKNEMVVRAEQAVIGMARVEELTDADVTEVEESEEAFAGVEDATREARGVFDLLQGYRWVEASSGDLMREANRERREADRLALRDPAASARHSERSGQLRRRGEALFLLLREEFGPPGSALDTFYGRVGDIDPAVDQLAKAIAVARLTGFLHWEVAFPGVWSNWLSAKPGGGFDAIIGNPPWDKMRFEEVPWFSPRVPAIAAAETSAARSQMIAGLRSADDPTWAAFTRARDYSEASMRMARLSPTLAPLAGGDTNIYALFVAQAQRLVNERGIVGLLVPTEIATGLATAGNFRDLSQAKRVACILDYQNRLTGETYQYFPDVYYREKFCAYVFGGVNRHWDAVECGYFLRATEDNEIAQQTSRMTPKDFSKVNPNTGTAPIFRTLADAQLTAKIYDAVPVLIDQTRTMQPKSWPVDYTTVFHMANSSAQFRTAVQLEASEHYPIAPGRWKKADDQWLALYEGKMVQAFNHRAASIRREEANLHRVAQPVPATADQLANPAWSPPAQFYVPFTPALDHWAVAIKDVTSVTNARTVISALIPSRAAGHTLPLLDLPTPMDRVLFAAALNSFAYDYSARQKVQKNHLVWHILEQLPMLSRTAYARTFGPFTAADLVRREVLHLTYTAHDMAPSRATSAMWTAIPAHPCPPSRGTRRTAATAAPALTRSSSTSTASTATTPPTSYPPSPSSSARTWPPTAAS
jgi:hypothetical protein